MSPDERDEALSLLREQLQTERTLVEMYEETSALILGESARWLLHMLQLDSRKHIAIFNLAIEIVEGRKIQETDRQEIAVGLEKHLELEMESIERARKIRGIRLLQENSGLSRLLEIWAEDEKVHHASLQRLRDEKYDRANVFDAYTEYRRTAFEQLVNELRNLFSR
jgi:rubrerythrin